MKKAVGKILAMSVALMLGMMPGTASASTIEPGKEGLGDEGGCRHVHHAACGYVEAVQASPCTFAHVHDADCGWAEAVAGAACVVEEAHTVHGEDCGGDPKTGQGCVFAHEVHDIGCGYVEAQDGAPCMIEDTHIHDSEALLGGGNDCGWAEAVDAAPCVHEHDADCGGQPQQALRQASPALPVTEKEYDISAGNITVSVNPGGTSMDITSVNGTESGILIEGITLVLKGTSTDTYTIAVVGNGVASGLPGAQADPVSIRLADGFSVSHGTVAPLALSQCAYVQLVGTPLLVYPAVLRATGGVRAGLEVPVGCRLLYSGGQVEASSEGRGAGIGGAGSNSGAGETAGEIRIIAGSVTGSSTATDHSGAGIGGGYGPEKGGDGGTIIITGGTAGGGSFGGGAGIGGGYSDKIGGDGGTITIAGGAAGGISQSSGIGAGIGGGGGGETGGDGGMITVTGGLVSGNSASGAGIGGGHGGDTGGAGDTITITGGIVTVNSASGAGIGGGHGGETGGDGGSITISGKSTVVYTTAISGGAGIGGGYGGETGGAGGTINITGSVVDVGAKRGAGIGGGYGHSLGGDGAALTITDAIVTAEASNDVPDIGSGVNRDGAQSQGGSLNIDSTGANRATLTLVMGGVGTGVDLSIGTCRITGAGAADLNGYYSIMTVENGTATYSPNAAWKSNIVKDGVTVSLTSAEPPLGQQLLGWSARPAVVRFANAASVSTSFSMPQQAVAVTARHGVPSLTIGIVSNNTAVIGRRYSESISYTYNGSNTLTFSTASTLPAGISLNTATGVISGTPAANTEGRYRITVTVRAGGLAATGSYTLTVQSAYSLALTNPGDQAAKLNEAFTLALTAAYNGSGSLTFNASGLPSGLSIARTTGVISGTPAEAGSYVVTVTVGDGSLTDEVIFGIHVADASPLTNSENNTITLPNDPLTAGVDFTFTAGGHRQDVATGTLVGDTRYIPESWSIDQGDTFPAGGPYTATTKLDRAGTYTLTVTYRLESWDGSRWNDTGITDTKSATLTVNAGGSMCWWWLLLIILLAALGVWLYVRRQRRLKG